MPSRTFWLEGSETGADITVTFNGTQVHNGAITSEESGVLCEFTADTTITGEIAVTVTVNSGSCTVGAIQANYVVKENAEYTTTDGDVIPAITADDVINTMGYMNNAAGNTVSNVQINDETPDFGGTADTGFVPMPLESGDVLSCNYTIDTIPS